MKDRFADYKINTKHMGLKFVMFVIMFIIAISSIGFGVSKLLSKDEGYYAIEEYVSDEAPLFGSGIELKVYLTGSSNEIKQKRNAIAAIYSPTLERAYKLTDPINEYEGFNNIATINHHIGEGITVPAELMEILNSAYELTLEAKGYNMFAGPLYRHWETILSLDDISLFDPTVNEEEHRRIAALSDKVNDLNLSSFKTDAEIKFSPDESLITFLKDNEEESDTIIDLNLLRDAYMVKMVAETLEKENISNGYIATDSGIVYNLSEHGNGEYAFYALETIKFEEGSEAIKPVVKMTGTADVIKGSCMSGFRNFALKDNELMYHVIAVYDMDGICDYILRSPFVNISQTGTNNYYDSVYAIAADGDIVGATYELIKVINDSVKIEDNPIIRNGINIFTFCR